MKIKEWLRDRKRGYRDSDIESAKKKIAQHETGLCSLIEVTGKECLAIVGEGLYPK